jgi:hypothetical protein
MYINGGTSTISRILFKDGRTTNYGAAIRVNAGNLNLESCIFSGNRVSASNSRGGAIDWAGGTLNVKGCTFYNNSGGYGGAIYPGNGTTILSGNLFYGNTASNGPVVYNSGGGTVTSNGYNVADTASPGYALASGDKTITAGVLPVSPTGFWPLHGSEAVNVITTLPAGYPLKDFYGDEIKAGAAAGAVQERITTGGYYLELSAENSGGSVSTTATPNADGLYSGTVTITATPGSTYAFVHWLVNGRIHTTSPLTLTLEGHTFVQAVWAFLVTDFTDVAGAATTPGTLRHALTNAIDGDTIRVSGVTAGETDITLNSELPAITRSITIEGNGVIITRASTLNARLMWTNNASAVVTISRVWFKDGRARTSSIVAGGGAISIDAGSLNLESCIFSGNRNSGGYNGGAIYKSGTGTLNVKGCTFYNNISTQDGGAIYNWSGTLNLTGNLFYGNTAPTGPAVYRWSGTVTSLGYNVVDSNSPGYTSVTGDTTIATLLGDNATSPFADISDPANPNLAPVSGLSIIPETWGVANMPATDFFGEERTWPGAVGAVK